MCVRLFSGFARAGSCNRPISDEMMNVDAVARGDRVMVFDCGHGYHETCLGVNSLVRSCLVCNSWVALCRSLFISSHVQHVWRRPLHWQDRCPNCQQADSKSRLSRRATRAAAPSGTDAGEISTAPSKSEGESKG